MISSDFNGTDQSAAAYFQEIGERIAEALRTGLQRSALQLARSRGATVRKYSTHLPKVSGKRTGVHRSRASGRRLRDAVSTVRRRMFSRPSQSLMRASLAEQRDVLVAELAQAIAAALKS